MWRKCGAINHNSHVAYIWYSAVKYVAFLRSCVLLYQVYKVPSMYGFYIHVGVEEGQTFLACIYMLLYLVHKSAKYSWLVYTCYCTWYRKVPNVPDSYIHVTVLGIEKCQIFMARVYTLLYLV
jgi:hypothetical protein